MVDPAELSNKMPLLYKDAPAAVVAVTRRIVLDSPLMVDPDMVTLPASKKRNTVAQKHKRYKAQPS